MKKDKIVQAFDAFVDERYADSEETLRTELRQAVNDFLKDKLQLKADPIQSVEDDDQSGAADDDAGTGEDDKNEE